jgi:hypothetical protein
MKVREEFRNIMHADILTINVCTSHKTQKLLLSTDEVAETPPSHPFSRDANPNLEAPFLFICSTQIL